MNSATLSRCSSSSESRFPTKSTAKPALVEQRKSAFSLLLQGGDLTAQRLKLLL